MTTIYKGWNAKIYIGTVSTPPEWTEVGCADSVSVDITSNVEPYYCIGSKTPAAILEGNQEITGSISHAWVNTYYLNLLCGGTLSTFHLLFKAGTSAGAPMVYLYNCKFESGSLDIPQDGVLTEDYDFRAESIAIEEVSG